MSRTPQKGKTSLMRTEVGALSATIATSTGVGSAGAADRAGGRRKSCEDEDDKLDSAFAGDWVQIATQSKASESESSVKSKTSVIENGTVT